MRHGRKSKSTKIKGYKSQIASDLDSGLILACAITPANRPETEAMPSLRDDLAFLDRALIELHIDRGFVASQVVREIVDRGGLVLCKSWVPNNGDLYSRADFNLQQKLRKLAASPAGRERLRERVGIEHSLAHMARRQGPSARHCGIRKNLFDARRTAAVQNLEPIQREAA